MLYSSANEELEENKNIETWWSDEDFVNEIDKEFKDLKQGKENGFTPEEIKSFMQEQKLKHRNK